MVNMAPTGFAEPLVDISKASHQNHFSYLTPDSSLRLITKVQLSKLQRLKIKIHYLTQFKSELVNTS